MKVLLDTHVLLWASASSARLPHDARELLEDGRNDVYYSAASIWEITIKAALGRDDQPIRGIAMKGHGQFVERDHDLAVER